MAILQRYVIVYVYVYERLRSFSKLHVPELWLISGVSVLANQR